MLPTRLPTETHSSPSSIDTQAKALTLNLDEKIYGTFAEIGAGQEIAGWFFRVGGASGTVAKTMSAYDMKVSDDIYGKVGRYVSEERLGSMLDHEYSLLKDRLSDSKGADRTFFVIANTVSARNYHGTNECHGWLGVRFQPSPQSEPCDIILHINMLDPDNYLQQQAVGILGVNLLYAAFNFIHDPRLFLMSLLDDLSLERIEIDVIRFSGSAFSGLSGHLCGAMLVAYGLASAVMFSPEGMLVQPSSIVRKKSVLVERGTYRIMNEVQKDVVPKARDLFKKSIDDPLVDPIFINEFSIKSVHQDNSLDLKQAVELIPKLTSHGSYLMLSSFSWYYNVSQYLRRYTKDPIGFLMGLSTVVKLFNESLYDENSGDLLEAIGKLLSIDVRLFAYPMSCDAIKEHLQIPNLAAFDWDIQSNNNFPTISTIKPKGPKEHLYNYLKSSGYLVGIE